MTDTITVRSLALTDDEVMALAAVSGRAWWTALRTVDVTDENDMVRASGRGLRSLAVRSLVNEDGEPDDALGLAATCLGARPWATAAAVDEQDRIPADAPILCLFRADRSAGLIAVRSDVSGTHVLHEIELEHSLELLAEQVSGEGAGDVAVAFWSSDRRPLGGLRRRGAGTVRVEEDGTPRGAVDDPTALIEAVRGFWAV
ncbi:hypothetical protein [Nocardioides zhouii]|uniref:Uncharacterized protein n=1 Tax=Nocardioides zhouii TaxID=1168729 RepID=A0A4Q2SZC5_9ACTN|nr:hypothetical protein [Nocardioides zhouii]RYC11053.1 hypothetical protein EUA94_10560 [Nocardioides zhouii]